MKVYPRAWSGNILHVKKLLSEKFQVSVPLPRGVHNFAVGPLEVHQLLQDARCQRFQGEGKEAV